MVSVADWGKPGHEGLAASAVGCGVATGVAALPHDPCGLAASGLDCGLGTAACVAGVVEDWDEDDEDEGVEDEDDEAEDDEDDEDDCSAAVSPDLAGFFVLFELFFEFFFLGSDLAVVLFVEDPTFVQAWLGADFLFFFGFVVSTLSSGVFFELVLSFG